MFPRILTRLPTRSIRHNSSTTSSTTTRVIDLAARASRPSPQLSLSPSHSLSLSLPLLWATTAGLALTAWNRMDERSAQGNVERLLVV